jgi:trimethylamine:corrinoid methyltransferase-like protein
MHTEHYYLEPVFDRKWRNLWEQAGATSAWDRAKEVASHILQEFTPQVLEPPVEDWIRGRFGKKLLL